jgi:hypothetical protein
MDKQEVYQVLLVMDQQKKIIELLVKILEEKKQLFEKQDLIRQVEQMGDEMDLLFL